MGFFIYLVRSSFLFLLIFVLFGIQMQQEIWAVDLDLNYQDSQVMFGLVQFVTNGTLDPRTHFFDIPMPKKEEKKLRRRKLRKEEEEEVRN